MVLLRAIMFAGAVALAGPVWADDDGRRHGRGHGYDGEVHRSHHHGWQGHRHHSGWGHHRHHHRDWHRAPRARHYYHQQYYAPPPVYGYAAPGPGIHIVAPNVFIPFR